MKNISEKKFIEHVSEVILKNSAALFVAAGLSASAGVSSWKSLLEPCAKELDLIITDDTDLYMIAQFYANNNKKADLVRKVESEINKINKTSKLLDSMLNLEFREIWTTNYDTLIEQNLQKRNIISKVINNDSDLNKFSEGGVHIYKMNGDVTNPEKMIITKNDLDRYFTSHELMVTFLKREFVTKSFLFIGYSFTDTLVLSCLNDIKHCLGDSCNVHYTILKKEESKYSEYFIDDLWERYNIETLIVDDYDGIPEILDKINIKNKEKRIFVSGAFDFLNQDEDIFANELCKELVHNLYDNNYKICTGMGRKVGNYLSGHAFQYLINRDYFDIEKHLIMKPFYEKMETNNKSDHRKHMLNNCSSAIFIFGKNTDKDNNIQHSQGMIEEFHLAKELNKIIIPLPTTGYAATDVFLEIKQHIIEYPYLEPYLGILETEKDPSNLAKVVVEILNDCLQKKV